MVDPLDDPSPTDAEIGSTAGHTHAEVLAQTLGFTRAVAALSQDGPPPARGSVLRERRAREEWP
ncbi:MAG: hypothetical protein QOE90_2519 [Thermoplasmata archaeon]|nr:hypothetical protein [Thermoplasmata archaeon]